jgi:hypothetical protein
MGAITFTPPPSATQRASWRHQDPDGVTYTAAVTRQSTIPDADGKLPWAFELGFMPAGAVGWHHTFARPCELIHAPAGSTPVRILATLASLVTAWGEAMSDNVDLFPLSCQDFLGAAESFAVDTEEWIVRGVEER